MTALPSVAPQLPVWIWVMVMPQSPIFSRKPWPRSLAAEEPTLPTSSTTFFFALSFEQIAHFSGGLAAFLDEVGADVGGIQVFGRIDAAVFQDDDLAGGLGFLQHIVPAGRLEGGEDDDVHFRILDEVAGKPKPGSPACSAHRRTSG